VLADYRPDRARASVLELPRTASSNVHRRCCRAIAARRPIQATIAAGDERTGVTIIAWTRGSTRARSSRPRLGDDRPRDRTELEQRPREKARAC
jgi:hypothetical protein